ncbi:hypothetical protein I1E95_02415 [Synechococcus sp. CBW1107]|uniref:hypothetical protein n=1 Tax=Synechococcus sp. CBW1107 TaxID=2789857 RepID=UPI0018CE1AFF|nr:hypothetical protein [Synechococcus sp. CBW1107]QPN57047.1 hypothetical protein I1E95_02415 [Synechococcus sp. CBW1107]
MSGTGLLSHLDSGHGHRSVHGLLAITPQAVFAATGGLQVTFRRDHDQTNGMIQAANLHRSAITAVINFLVAVVVAKPFHGSLQEGFAVDPHSHGLGFSANN